MTPFTLVFQDRRFFVIPEIGGIGGVDCNSSSCFYSRISNTNADETPIAKSNKFHANTGVLTGVFPPCFQLDPGDVSCINYTVISISTGILCLV